MNPFLYYYKNILLKFKIVLNTIQNFYYTINRLNTYNKK